MDNLSDHDNHRSLVGLSHGQVLYHGQDTLKGRVNSRGTAQVLMVRGITGLLRPLAHSRPTKRHTIN
jgi:hypothetical protein